MVDSISIDNLSRARRLQSLKKNLKHPQSLPNLELVFHLQNARDTDEFSGNKDIVDRWVLLALANVLELEAHHMFESAFRSLWGEKDRAIQCLFDENSRFLDEVRSSLSKIQNQNPLWLSTREFPVKRANDLLYSVLQEKDLENFKPDLLAMGVILFFFSQDQLLEKFPLRNVLGFLHPSSDELNELSLRLIRTANLRRSVFGVAPEGQGPVEQFENDLFRLFELVTKIQY